MSTTLYKYRIYCTTDSKFEYIWVESTASEPTTCPTNTAHTIDAGQTRIVEQNDPDIVSIKQETTNTGQHYRWDSIAFDALANQTTTYTFSYPYPISVLDALMITDTENKGDIITWRIAPDTTIGALTADVAVNDTIINVSSTVTDNIALGFHCNLFDGVNTDELGAVIGVDSVAGTITVETAATQIFLASSPTYVRMNIYFLKDVEMGHPGRLNIGDSKIESSYVPANTVVECQYTNNHETLDKRYVAYLEILF
jgi:hypothetical protein